MKISFNLLSVMIAGHAMTLVTVVPVIAVNVLFGIAIASIIGIMLSLSG